MVFVVALTFIVYLLALGLSKHGPIELLDDYAKGFWVLLTFAMQLTVMMVTGFVVADSKPVKSGLIKLVDSTKSAKTTLFVYCLIVGLVSWLHWAIGIMVSIVMGKEVAVRKLGLGIHYPVLCAASYSMMMIMANGPSQSAPLLAATPGNFLEPILGGLIPLTQTALSPFLLVLMAFQYLTIPLLLIWLMPKKENAIELDDATYQEFTYVPPTDDATKDLRPAERWERSKFLLTLLGLGILVWVVKFIVTQGFGKLDLNVINFAFFGLGMILHGTPRSFIASVKQGVGTTFGVIIQFPLYAGIYGLISFSGLAATITHWFISISTTETFSWIVFIYTTVMDFFVPSGGSKFAIEAPYIIPAGGQLGISASHIVNSYSTGGQLANNIQPFWALPFLAAYKLKFQDILPYTFAVFLYCLIVGSAVFLIFPKGI
jgi:short-chain fatty acids transporter